MVEMSNLHFPDVGDALPDLIVSSVHLFQLQFLNCLSNTNDAPATTPSYPELTSSCDGSLES